MVLVTTIPNLLTTILNYLATIPGLLTTVQNHLATISDLLTLILAPLTTFPALLAMFPALPTTIISMRVTVMPVPPVVTVVMSVPARRSVVVSSGIAMAVTAQARMPAIIEVCRDIEIGGRIPTTTPVTGTDPVVLIPTIVTPLSIENVAAVVEYVNAEHIVVVAIAGIGDH
ncbi:hypothetical protein AWR36_004210 [Microbulbifer flavimaris]|uniref:Uncharacterized protein n=1 Tax=Microbulbifer flavimaris TaxID=1781068 RepID=A0ABX4I3M7_9GAMM|nr:hypothetical protein AVO43_04210 [Microbulbifer sp. ZGT114]PCO06946.1 hypothetical protein AWR36_004210 [Microbulbifer flavimaris]